MKKIFVLLLMFTLFVAVSCDDDEGVQGVISLQDLNSYQIHPLDADGNEVDVTDLSEYNKGDDALIFGKFATVLDDSNSGWAAYRYTSDPTATGGVTDDATDATDCDAAYKVSYFERAAQTENINRFVGGGMCLDSGSNSNTDARVENLRDLVDGYVDEISTGGTEAIADGDDDTMVDNHITAACTTYTDIPNIPSLGLNDEMDELYLFVAELVEGDGTAEAAAFSVNIECHPNADLVDTDAYGLTDDYGRAFIKEVVDELSSLEPNDGTNSNDQALIDEGVWNVYAFPKLNQPDTLSDPPKLSYFRIVNDVGANDRDFIVGAGIYLDKDNPNVDPNSLTRLEVIRNRVINAAGLLLDGEGENGALPDMFFEDEPDTEPDDPDDFYSTVVDATTAVPQEFIFVWESQ